MVGAVLAEVKGLVDRRFLLTAFFPVLVFVLIAGLLFAEANDGVGGWVARWEALSGGAQALSAVAVLAGTFLAASFLCLVSLLSTVLAVGGGAYAALEGFGVATYLSLVVVGLAVARLSYNGAVEAAVEYGLHIRSAFDLYRNELLAQLGRALPATQEEERRTWEDVSERLRTGEQWPVRYVRVTRPD